MAYSTTIGDQQPVAVAPALVALPQSVVLAADLIDIDSAINNAQISGKQAGATVIQNTAGVHALAVAQGGETDSTWLIMDVTTVITPA
jgi:hypothetical protein